MIRRRNRTEFDHGHHLAVGFTENLALFEVPTRDLNAERRLRVESQGDATRIEEQLELAMAFAECLRIDNPLSPPEMRLAFQCWNELTHGGTFNPAGPGGRGIHGLGMV